MEGQGTPFGDKFQLYCELGFYLRISENGEISGTQDESDSYTCLQLVSGNGIGLVKIQGLESGLYICFEETGALRGGTNPEITGTTFKEALCGSYNCYECVEYQGWFIGLSKKGRAKNGNTTKAKNESVKFLPKRI